MSAEAAILLGSGVKLGEIYVLYVLYICVYGKYKNGWREREDEQ